MQGAPEEDVSPLSALFSTRRPRDWRSGLASGSKSLLKGVAGGVAGLVAAPVVGAATEGATGFAKGLAAGVVGAVLLPVAGAGVAVAQVARGVAATPAAARERAAGRVWDREGRAWVDPAGALVEGASGGGGGPTAAAPPPPVSDGTDFYALLAVPRSADPAALKAAYFAAARRLHPDRPGGDAAAFQAVGKAYAVLSDPTLRARYDAGGAAAVAAEGDGVDAVDLFAALFGGPAFERWVGESALAVAARGGGAGGDPAAVAAAQTARVATVTRNLVDTLRQGEGGGDGAAAAFRARAAADAAALVRAPWGAPTLALLADVYIATADRELRGPAAGTAVAAVHAARRFGARARAVSSAVRAAAHAATADGGGGPAPAAPTADDAGLPLFLDAAWRANKLDCWLTLDAAARAALADAPAGPPRAARAGALRALGDAFRAAAAAAGDEADRAARRDAGAARARVEAAAASVIEGRQRAREEEEDREG